MLELLAPAGSMEALRAAVQNGANAVYLGCGAFNARQSAKNFTLAGLAEAVKYCHVRGVDVHLTLNTLVSDNEMKQACDLIAAAAGCGVDAFIVQDLGVAEMCRSMAPGVAVHGSTQMTVHNLDGVLQCAAMGMSRVVVSRELSREEIRYLCSHSPIEIEVFVHGALCMCYSGQCYLSAAIGGRSGNRGRCAQPCRQSYGYGRWENKYPLSLKDNCLATYLRELETMGVASVKIEGRMKKPEYVATVTQVYRQAIDSGAVTRPMFQALMTAFNRQGFTDGYYRNDPGPGMLGIREDKPEDPRWLEDARQSYETAERGLVDVHFTMEVTGTGCFLRGEDRDGHVGYAEGPVPEIARNLPLTAEMLAGRLSKTGGTPYRCVHADVRVEGGLMLPASAVNGMRREVLDQLTAQRGRVEPPEIHKMPRITRVNSRRSAPALTVQVTELEQITLRLLRAKPEVLYVPLHLLASDWEMTRQLASQVRVAAVLPRIVHDPEMSALNQQLARVRDWGVREVLVGNIGLIRPMLDQGFAVRGDFGLNVYNSVAVNSLWRMGMASVTLSMEMTMPQIRDVSKAAACELLCYGRMPLMVMENCLMKNRTGQCSCHLGSIRLTDKTGADFPVIRDGGTCRSVLLNGKKLYWLDRREDLAQLGIWASRLYFTTENAKEVDRVLAAYQSGAAFDPGACTRGLYLRGVE